jgi:hypothetical protein
MPGAAPVVTITLPLSQRAVSRGTMPPITSAGLVCVLTG